MWTSIRSRLMEGNGPSEFSRRRVGPGLFETHPETHYSAESQLRLSLFDDFYLCLHVKRAYATFIKISKCCVRSDNRFGAKMNFFVPIVRLNTFREEAPFFIGSHAH